MIFFDATGKRWRNIKLSAAGIAVLAATPICLLGVGTLVYQPKWGQLPLISQARNFVDQAATIATQQVSAATHPSPSASPSPSSSTKPSSKLLSKSAGSGTAAAPAPTPAVLAAQTLATPRATISPKATPTPTTAPGNSASHPTPNFPPQSHRH